jgi:hypothetical protein
LLPDEGGITRPHEAAIKLLLFVSCLGDNPNDLLCHNVSLSVTWRGLLALFP